MNLSRRVWKTKLSKLSLRLIMCCWLIRSLVRLKESAKIRLDDLNRRGSHRAIYITMRPPHDPRIMTYTATYTLLRHVDSGIDRYCDFQPRFVPCSGGLLEDSRSWSMEKAKRARIRGILTTKRNPRILRLDCGSLAVLWPN